MLKWDAELKYLDLEAASKAAATAAADAAKKADASKANLDQATISHGEALEAANKEASRLASVTKKATEAFEKMHAEDIERFDESAIEEVLDVMTASSEVKRMESALKDAENTVKDLNAAEERAPRR